MWAPTFSVRIKFTHCRLHFVMEILISFVEAHISVHIYAIPEAWDMSIGSERGHEGSRALSDDAGRRFKFMGQNVGLVCFLCL